MGALVSFSEDLLSGNDVLPQHFVEKDVVDFDVMCRESVVQERWREHHVIPVEPELNTVLGVELVLISRFGESKSSENHKSSEEVDEHTSVIEGSVSCSEESGANRSHATVDLEHTHPEVVDNSESSVQSVGAVLSLAHLNLGEDFTNDSGSLSKSFVDNILEVGCVGEEPLLEFLRHFLKIIIM